MPASLLHKARDCLGEDPLALCEEIAEARQWLVERQGEREMSLHIVGEWCDCDILLEWHGDRGLHLLCGFGIKALRHRRGAVLELISRINARLWMGHFTIGAEDSAILYRAALPLADRTPSMALCDLFLGGCEEAADYALAFQSVLWSGVSPDEAIAIAAMRVEGRA